MTLLSGSPSPFPLHLPGPGPVGEAFHHHSRHQIWYLQLAVRHTGVGDSGRGGVWAGVSDALSAPKAAARARVPTAARPVAAAQTRVGTRPDDAFICCMGGDQKDAGRQSEGAPMVGTE